LRPIYVPARETSGWLPLPLRPLATVAGRPLLGGLKLMLDGFRLFNDAENRRLPALLKASRDAQTTVSTMLYEGLLTVLMRLVFVLYAEDRDLIPSRTAVRRTVPPDPRR
jgi:hypothetical protein